MKPLISTPAAIHQVGNRSTNEDSIYPPLGLESQMDDLFIVCDGIGGSANGEIASQLTCQGFVDFFKKQKLEVSTAALLNEALVIIETAFDNYVKINKEAKGMGTTLSLLHFHKQGATLSYCGDSRIYHIRNGEILFQTEDHSWVNEMVKNKILTKEEAIDHPKKNVIIRAIQAGDKKAILDSHFIKDIRSGDYFFMCTDGILEQITNEILTNTLNGKTSPQDGIKTIASYCEGKTKDNYSAYLIQIAKEELIFSMEAVEKENFKWVKAALVVVIIIVLCLFGSKFFFSNL